MDSIAEKEQLFVDQPAFQPRRLKIICVGAGFSGLTLAYKVQHDRRNSHLDLVIFEKNGDVGGTWLENIYPGVACDVGFSQAPPILCTLLLTSSNIPAHSYALPFAPNPDWSAYYVSGGEIFAYIKDTTRKYELDKSVAFNSQVLGATWDESTSQWTVSVRTNNIISTHCADILVNGGGFLNNPKWPEIEGLPTFGGTAVHSASWPSSLDWTGKRIGLIGNGSSGIQILPQIAKTASRVITYIRSPTWIATPLGADPNKGASNFSYSAEEKERFNNCPDVLQECRADIEHRMNSRFPSVLDGSDMSKLAEQALRKLMRQRLNDDPMLTRKLIPEFPVSCRRVTPGEGYLESLLADNVTVRFDPILRVNERGVVVSKTLDGQEHHEVQEEEDALDIIICATGFDVSFVPKWLITGRRGKTLTQQWSSHPEAYLGICAPNMPNFFMSCGPNTPVSQGSLSTVIDLATDYMLKWCRKISTQNIKSIVVNENVCREYNEYMQEFLSRTVWAGNCRSWYKNGTVGGKITGVYGGSIVHFLEVLEAFRVEDFDIITEQKNRFRFLGNGRSRKELSGNHLGFYVGKQMSADGVRGGTC